MKPVVMSVWENGQPYTACEVDLKAGPRERAVQSCLDAPRFTAVPPGASPPVACEVRVGHTAGEPVISLRCPWHALGGCVSPDSGPMGSAGEAPQGPPQSPAVCHSNARRPSSVPQAARNSREAPVPCPSPKTCLPG